MFVLLNVFILEKETLLLMAIFKHNLLIYGMNPERLNRENGDV